MISRNVICLWLHGGLFCVFTVLGVEPMFDVPLVNVTVVAGQAALLPCSVKDIGKYKVSLVPIPPFLCR